MSIEKVRRYTAGEIAKMRDDGLRRIAGEGMYPATRIAAIDAVDAVAFIEYADVAGLVESSDAVLDAAKVIQITFADSDYYSVPKHIIDTLRDELARWQS